MRINKGIFLSIICGIVTSLVLFFTLYQDTENSELSLITAMELTPWSGIGGCGAGAGGGGTNDGIRWIGSGVSGGLIDLEMLSRFSIGQNFRYFTFSPRFSYKPSYTTTMNVAIPVLSKTGTAQNLSNSPENERTTGGLGDISLDFAKSIGMNGQYLITLGLTFPTGQYDIKRVRDKEPEFLPVHLQKGTGLYNASMAIERMVDIEDGMWTFSVSYSHPLALRPFSKQNEFLDSYFGDYKDRKNNRRFYYRSKPYGENDLGDYNPPSLTANVYFTSRKFEHHIHSWGVMFSAPLGVAWVHSPNISLYNPAPDPDHKSWNATLLYGVEFSREKLPLYLAVSLPIHDKADPRGIWDAPDWEDFMQQWTFAFGFKTTFF
ncbi:MAG: hypothetical protein JW915_05410 [Chitinispirillaceae bacterium]|nr:hypothetical protein [Chitinispirillaceae bacterium]